MLFLFALFDSHSGIFMCWLVFAHVVTEFFVRTVTHTMQYTQQNVLEPIFLLLFVCAIDGQWEELADKFLSIALFDVTKIFADLVQYARLLYVKVKTRRPHTNTDRINWCETDWPVQFSIVSIHWIVTDEKWNEKNRTSDTEWLQKEHLCGV